MLKPTFSAIMLMLASTSPAVAQPPGLPAGKFDGLPMITAGMLEKKANDLSLLIGLKPAQRPALEAMLRAGMPPAKPEGWKPESREAGPPPVLAGQSFAERLAQMEQHSSERAKAEHERIAALGAFYKSLDAQQRARFEAVIRLSHGGLAHRGPGGFGPPPPPPHRPEGPSAPKS